MRRHDVLVDGILTAVLEAGEPTATTAVVVVHGNPGSLVEFERLVAAVAPFSRVVAMDMPGFGNTPAPQDFDVSPVGYGRHLALLLDELNVDRAHLVLHDFGGPFGLQFAIDAPTRVASLLLVDVLGMPGYRWHRMAKAWRTPGLGEAVMMTTNRAMAGIALREGNPVPLPSEAVDRMVEQFRGRGAEVVLALYRATPPDWGDRNLAAMQDLDVPVMVLWGDRDAYISPKQAQTFALVFPQASFVILRGVGHWPMLTAPDRFEAAALPWLQDVTRN